MKSIVMKSIYAGLGLLGTGKQSVEQLARELSRKANLSEKEGEKIARHLSQQSEKVIHTLQKSLNTEVTKVVRTLHEATKAARKRAAPVKAKPRARRRTKRKAAGA